MTGRKAIYKLLIPVILLLAMGLGGTGLPHKSAAQTAGPLPFITWQARSYAPPQYRGKAMPTAGSQITVNFNIVNQGKIADLSKQTINWYLSGNILGSGKGMQTLTFLAPTDGSSAASLSIELPDYTSQLLIYALDIPIVNPEAVIEAPYVAGVFSGNSLQVRGTPYFFNVSSPLALNFAWSVNGETPQNAEDPSVLAVNIGSGARPGSSVDIGLTISSPSDILAAAQTEATLTIGR